MRFTVHRLTQRCASPRSHPVSQGDVLSRVRVSVVGVAAGDAAEVGLALARLRCDHPAARTTLRCVRGGDVFHTAPGFVFKTLGEHAPRLVENRTVEARFLPDVHAGLFDRAFRGAGHIANLEVLHSDDVVAGGDVRSGLLYEVLTSVGAAGLGPTKSRLDAGSAVRPSLTPCQLALQPHHAGVKVGADVVVKRAIRQRGSVDDATIHTDNLARLGAGDRVGDMCERDVPTSGTVQRHPVRLEVAHSAGATEPHPTDLRNLQLGPAAVQLSDIGGTGGDDAEAFVESLLTERRRAVCATEEVTHRLVEVSKRLLLHHLRTGTQPVERGAGLCQLLVTGQMPRRPRTGSGVVGLLLDGQIPDKTCASAVRKESLMLSLGRVHPVPCHLSHLPKGGTGSGALARRRSIYCIAVPRHSPIPLPPEVGSLLGRA